MEDAVHHNEDKKRFYVNIGNAQAKLDYETSPDGKTLDYRHTYVPPQLRGRRIGEKIVLFALAYAKDNQLKVIPTCPFVKRVIESHPEYQSLVVS